jgi:hypothetical protein
MKNGVRLALLLGAVALAACASRNEPGAIHLVVEQRLMEPLAGSLTQLAADLDT